MFYPLISPPPAVIIPQIFAEDPPVKVVATHEPEMVNGNGSLPE